MADIRTLTEKKPTARSKKVLRCMISPRNSLRRIGRCPLFSLESIRSAVSLAVRPYHSIPLDLYFDPPMEGTISPPSFRQPEAFPLAVVEYQLTLLSLAAWVIRVSQDHFRLVETAR